MQLKLLCLRRIKSKKEKEELKRKHKLRIKSLRAARRSGKLSKKEGKAQAADAKKTNPISQRRMAAIKKSRY